MKKNITIVVLVALAAVLLYFLLNQGEQPDSHKYDYDLVQADLKIVTEQRNAGLKRVDSLEAVIKGDDTVKAQLKTELAGTRKDLDKSTSRAVQLAREIRQLKSDTTERDDKCDSLANEVENISYLYAEYKSFGDSLARVMDKNEGDYKAALNEQKRLYSDLYVKYEQLYRLYDNLFKDYTGARKSMKREKLKTKVAALLALVGGAAAALK